MECRKEVENKSDEVNYCLKLKDWRRFRIRESVLQKKRLTYVVTQNRSQGVQILRQTLGSRLDGQKVVNMSGSMKGVRKTRPATDQQEVGGFYKESAIEKNCPPIIFAVQTSDEKQIKRFSRQDVSQIQDSKIVLEKFKEKKDENKNSPGTSKRISSNRSATKKKKRGKSSLKKSSYSPRFVEDNDIQDRSELLEKDANNLENTATGKKVVNAQGSSPSGETTNDQLSNASKILQKRISNVIERRKPYEKSLSALKGGRNHEYINQRLSPAASSESEQKYLKNKKDDYSQNDEHSQQADAKNSTDNVILAPSKGTSNVQSTSSSNRTPKVHPSEPPTELHKSIENGATKLDKSDKELISLHEEGGIYECHPHYNCFSASQSSPSQRKSFSQEKSINNGVENYIMNDSKEKNKNKHNSRKTTKFHKILLCCTKTNSSSTSTSRDSSTSSRKQIPHALSFVKPISDSEKCIKIWRNETTQTYFSETVLSKPELDENNPELKEKKDQSTITDVDTRILPEYERNSLHEKLIIPVNVKCFTTLSITPEVGGRPNIIKFADNNVTIEIKGGDCNENVHFKTQRQEMEKIMNTKMDIWPKNSHIVNALSEIDITVKHSTVSIPNVANIPSPGLWNYSSLFYNTEEKLLNKSKSHGGLRSCLSECKVVRGEEFYPSSRGIEEEKTCKDLEVLANEIVEPKTIQHSNSEGILGARSSCNIKGDDHESKNRKIGELKNEEKGFSNVSLQTSRDLLESLAEHEFQLDLVKNHKPYEIMNVLSPTSNSHLHSFDKERENKIHNVDSPETTGYLKGNEDDTEKRFSTESNEDSVLRDNSKVLQNIYLDNITEYQELLDKKMHRRSRRRNSRTSNTFKDTRIPTKDYTLLSDIVSNDNIGLFHKSLTKLKQSPRESKTRIGRCSNEDINNDKNKSVNSLDTLKNSKTETVCTVTELYREVNNSPMNMKDENTIGETTKRTVGSQTSEWYIRYLTASDSEISSSDFSESRSSQSRNMPSITNDESEDNMYLFEDSKMTSHPKGENEMSNHDNDNNNNVKRSTVESDARSSYFSWRKVRDSSTRHSSNVDARPNKNILDRDQKSIFKNMCEKIGIVFPCFTNVSTCGNKYSSQEKTLFADEFPNLCSPITSTVSRDKKNFHCKNINGSLCSPLHDSKTAVWSSVSNPRESETMISNEVNIGFKMGMLTKELQGHILVDRKVKGTTKRTRKRKSTPFYQRYVHNSSRSLDSYGNFDRNNESNDDGLEWFSRLLSRKWSPTYNDLNNIPFIFPPTLPHGHFIHGDERSICKNPYSFTGSRDTLNLNWKNSDFSRLPGYECENSFLSNSHDITEGKYIQFGTRRISCKEKFKKVSQFKQNCKKRKISSEVYERDFFPMDTHKCDDNIFEDYISNHLDPDSTFPEKYRQRESKISKLNQENQFNHWYSKFNSKQRRVICSKANIYDKKNIYGSSEEKSFWEYEFPVKECDADDTTDVFLTKSKLFEDFIKTEEVTYFTKHKENNDFFLL